MMQRRARTRTQLVLTNVREIRYVRMMSDIDYELEDELAADTPERLKALAEPIRMAICDLVLQGAMSVSELATVLGRPRGSVAHHVHVLVDAGLIRVVRSRKVRAMTESFYGRTARTYLMASADGELPFIQSVQREYPAQQPPKPHSNRDGFATLRHARISADRFEEYVERLAALTLEFSAEPRSGTREHAIYVLAFPTTRFAS